MDSIGYDVIGDIHGEAAKLKALLLGMGYTRRSGSWRPPEGRQALFIGDLIDRGPEQIEVLEIVRSMMDAGHARAVLGNHEFNAIGYATPNELEPGQFLRPHCPKNIKQHREFLNQVGEGSSRHREYIDWFRTLPVVLDLGGIRAVHACWRDADVALVQAARLSDAMSIDFIQEAFNRKSDIGRAMERLTKGVEIPLPAGITFKDHAGDSRTDIRTRWWHETARTYRDVAIVSDETRPLIPDQVLLDIERPVAIDGSPVFVGHYWMSGVPKLQSPKVACVDYSAAGDGPLVAYRWQGEAELDARQFVMAGGRST
jgi:hypothetical protein